MKALINGVPFTFTEKLTVLEAVRKLGFFVPTLCAYPTLESTPGSCGLCIVKIKYPDGREVLSTSCKTGLEDGMEIRTDSPEVRQAQRKQLALLFADHDMNCMGCDRHGKCELLDLAEKLDLKKGIAPGSYKVAKEEDYSDRAIWLDPNKCIRCERCVEVCGKVQGLYVLTMKGSGRERAAALREGKPWALSDNCVRCGQCTVVCPTGALQARDQVDVANDYLTDPGIYTVFQFAPAVRATLGEEFGFPAGVNVERKIVEALKKAGADCVLDTNFSADVVIMEEGTELLNRLNDKNAVLPMFTSCCPAWINFVELHKPELIPHISTTRSPQAVMGSLIKSWLPEKKGIPKEKIRSISIMPCTAKKDEAARQALAKDAVPDVDLVLTVREFAKLLKGKGIDLRKLEGQDFDTPFMSKGSGAAVIFGKTAGVAEAAARTVYYVLTGKNVNSIQFKTSEHPHVEQELTIDLGEGKSPLRIGVVHGLANADYIADEVLSGKSPFDFIEVMSCPGGCINGGGTPREAGDYHPFNLERTKVLTTIDEKHSLRQSHNNPMVKELYKEYLGEPNSHLAHELLHMEYQDRKSGKKLRAEDIWKEITLC